MKKVFLHIGLHKTGSTTIQAFLHQNCNELGNFGYLYPKTGVMPEGKAHHNLVWLLKNDTRANLSFGTWKELYEEIETTNFDNIIITSEDFGSSNKTTINTINSLKTELQSYEVKIIVYIRRQDRRLESQYTQHIKQGTYNGNILSFCRKRKADSNYYKLLESWKQAFGINNLIVRPLDKVQIPNISHDFLKIIGITNLSCFDEVENQNIRPGIKTLEVLRLVNKIYKNKPQKERRKYLNKIAWYTQKYWSEERSYRLLSYSEALKILELYKQSNQAVAQEYLGREDGVLFYEQLEPYDNHKFEIADLSKEELLSLTQAIESTEQVQADKEELLSLIQAVSTNTIQGKTMLIPTNTESVKASEYLNQANEHQQQGNINQALESYQKTIELNPNSIPAWSKSAAIYEKQENWAEASKCYQRIIDLKPEKHAAYTKLARVLEKQNEIDGAITAYHKAIEIKPSNPEFYLKLAELYFKKNNIDGVIDSYQKAIKLKPDIGFNIYKQLSQALELQGRKDEIATWMKLAPKPEEREIYFQIWEALNQTDLKQLENDSDHYPTTVDQDQAEQYFLETSQYKIIRLNSVNDEDKQFLESAGLSLTYLKLNQARLITQEGVIEEESDKLEKLKRLRQKHSKLEEAAIKGDFQQYITKKGCIYAICPSTGRVLSSNRSLTFCYPFAQGCYRFVGKEVFYLIAVGIEFYKYAFYFPSSELIIYLSELNTTAHLPDAENINTLKAYLVSCWKKIRSYLLTRYATKTVVVLGWHPNIGHQIWNNLSGIHKLWQAGNLHKVDKFLISKSKNEYYGSLEEIFPEIPPEKIQRVERPKKVDEEIWENNYFALRLGDVVIKKDLANRVYQASLQKCSPSLKAEIEAAKNNHFPLLWVTIRLGNRTWVNQVEGLANIIKSLSEQFPKLGVVFDGCSRIEVEGKLVVDEKLEASINKEKEIVRQIQSLLPPEIKVYDTVGSRMYESIVWAYAIDLYLAHWSGGTSKVTWIAGKPGVIHTCKVVYRRPLLKRDHSWERENGIVPVYVPEEHIVDVTEGYKRRNLRDKRRTLHNYDCDWRVIYEEVLKLTMSIKRD